MKKIFIIALVVCFFAGCKQRGIRELESFKENGLPGWNKKLTRVLISDVFSPPVCSRIYAYCNIAAYEALAAGDNTNHSFAGKLNGLKAVVAPADKNKMSFPVASVLAFTTVAQKLVFNTGAMKELEAGYLAQLDSLGFTGEARDSSVAYGITVGKHIIEWASKDGYLQRSSNSAFLVTKDPARWKPTPPDYTDAVEPNWGTLRPFAMDSASQFRPAIPWHFDTAKNSELYKEAMVVYDAVSKPGPEFTDIARYWDCNPNVSVTDGHVTYFQQQVSPGGHWIFIAGSVTEKEKFSPIKTAALMAKVAVALADGFISCWEAKYTYASIRPETFINLYIDKNWKPFIQTPPFPEYPSGHSTISSGAATILTHIVGDKYVFTDSAEVEFGRPAKQFSSFKEAAQEASISRLYGGIHFLKALNTGVDIGKNVADYLISKFDQP